MSFMLFPNAAPQHDTHPVFGTRQPVLCEKECCGAGSKPAAKPMVKVVAPPARRARLADLDANIHCSIVGTCLSTTELRKLIGRYVL